MIAKYLIPIVAVISFGGGSFFGAKVLDKKCPDCNPVFKCPEVKCPEAVSLQTFDLSKLNNKKGNFSYAPQLHDVTVQINCSDSTMIKELLRKAR